MRRQDNKQGIGARRGRIGRLIGSLQSVTDQLVADIVSSRHADGEWVSPMPGGMLQSVWALLAEAEWLGTEASVGSVEALIRGILANAQPGGFAATPGGPIDSGATRFVCAALRSVKSTVGVRLSGDLVERMHAVIHFQSRGDAPSHSSVYALLGRLIESFQAGNERLVAFPFHPTLGVLVTRHWTFGWLRRRLSRPFVIILPAAFAWHEAAAECSLLVRGWRACVDALGISRYRTRRKSLTEHILAVQSVNGSWAWGTLGTAMALVALSKLGESRDSEAIARGLEYLRSLRLKDEPGIERQSWARASTWDTAINGQALQASPQTRSGAHISAAVQMLRAHQVQARGLEFDAGVGMPDNDSTSVALAFLARASAGSDTSQLSLLQTAIEQFLGPLLDQQSRLGGWCFSGRRGGRRSGYSAPTGGVSAVALDEPSPEITARALLALAATRQLSFLDISTVDAIDVAIGRALAYAGHAQQADGAWVGRWSDGPVSATSEMLVALCAVDEDPSSDVVRRARRYLLAAARQPDKLAAAEASWAAAAITCTSQMDSLLHDEELLSSVEALLQRVTDGSPIATRYVYPVVYPQERFAAPAFERARVLFALRLLATLLQRGVSNARREILWGHAFAPTSPTRRVRDPDLAERFQAIRAAALWLGGRPEDIGQRIVAHFSVYRDSRRNFTFPLLALHGAGWAHGYFRLLDFVLAPYATVRHPISAARRAELIQRMRTAMNGFKFANRRVLADTFANYHFSKLYGHRPRADSVLSAPLLRRLNWLHATVKRGENLTQRSKSHLYSEAFHWEQTNSVWPMVERTIRDINDPIVTFIAFRPIVRFAYFRGFQLLVFSDFTKTEERISQGFRAYQIAESAGWADTERSMRSYGFLPADLSARSDLLLRWSNDLALIDRMPPDPLSVTPPGR